MSTSPQSYNNFYKIFHNSNFHKKFHNSQSDKLLVLKDKEMSIVDVTPHNFDTNLIIIQGLQLNRLNSFGPKILKIK